MEMFAMLGGQELQPHQEAVIERAEALVDNQRRKVS